MAPLILINDDLRAPDDTLARLELELQENGRTLALITLPVTVQQSPLEPIQDAALRALRSILSALTVAAGSPGSVVAPAQRRS